MKKSSSGILSSVLSPVTSLLASATSKQKVELKQAVTISRPIPVTTNTNTDTNTDSDTNSDNENNNERNNDRNTNRNTDRDNRENVRDSDSDSGSDSDNGKGKYRDYKREAKREPKRDKKKEKKESKKEAYEKVDKKQYRREYKTEEYKKEVYKKEDKKRNPTKEVFKERKSESDSSNGTGSSSENETKEKEDSDDSDMDTRSRPKKPLQNNNKKITSYPDNPNLSYKPTKKTIASATPETFVPSPSTLRSHGVLLIASSELVYDPFKELGFGSQGIAYRARWKSRDVVFKKIHAKNNDQKQEFLRELDVWKNIHHANAIQLFGAIDDPGKCGYIMEYCPNGNLSNQMNNGLVLGPLKIIELACGVSDILSVLHDSAIVHRDIKSANVMLDSDFNPKLGDFGLSRMLAEHQASATNLSGTPTHMAPEQFIQGGKHNPKKADVYSFGMLLYEIATNKTPFHGSNQFEIMHQLNLGVRPQIPADTPAGMEESEQRMWWDIVAKCWAQDPQKRISMEEAQALLCELRKTIFERLKGFSCLAHKTGRHDYFLSYRVATESNTVHKLFELLSLAEYKSTPLKVFLDAKCLPYAEDWQKSFLFGLHHSKIIVPILSAGGLAHLTKAHEENDNMLLEFEHMLSLLKVLKGRVKVFPIFINDFPRALDYPDKPHITTGKNIRQTLNGISRLQGLKITTQDLHTVVPVLLAKLDELESGRNASLTLTEALEHTDEEHKEELKEVYIKVEGDARASSVEVNPSCTLQELRTIIAEQLDFDFPYKFLKKCADAQFAVVSTKQESLKSVASVLDSTNTILVQKT